ncbi:MAG TPA: hypothetical protein VFQ38_17900 [Longimicrobiales bacterium]|nr:hypothetical protein [Longimicrobiales bacterium]
MLIFYTLLALVALRVVLIVVAIAVLVGPANACPACFQPTLAVHRRWLRWLASGIEWRWCPTCGWQGPARRSEPEPPPQRPVEPTS